LRDLFAASQGAETQRLYYLASRINFAGTATAGWKLPLSEATTAVSH
jgi:hypothetical protein